MLTIQGAQLMHKTRPWCIVNTQIGVTTRQCMEHSELPCSHRKWNSQLTEIS